MEKIDGPNVGRYISSLRGSIAQSVEQRPFKASVVGSSPTALT